MGIIDTEELFEQLIEQYGKLIFSVCCSMTGDYFAAEDLTQETFLSAYKHYPTLETSHIKALLVKIASNRCCDYLKNASRRTAPTEDEFLNAVTDPSAAPEEIVLEKEMNARLHKLCQKLNEPYKTVATKHFCQNLPIREIAADTGRNSKTLQTQIYRAKAMLRKLWKEEFL